MAKRWRAGSVYENHRGTVVRRGRHLYEVNRATSTQRTTPEKRAPFPTGRESKHSEKVRAATDLAFEQLVSRKPKGMIFMEVEQIRAKNSLEAAHLTTRRWVDLYERTRGDSFLSQRKAKKMLARHIEEEGFTKKDDTLGENFARAVRGAPTSVLIAEHDHAVMTTLGLVRGQDTPAGAARLRAAVELREALDREILRRVGEIDEDALNYVKNLPDRSLEWALAERDIYGENFLKPWKALSAEETQKELGCDTDALVVLLWTGVIERQLTEEEMVQGEKRSIAEASFCALSVTLAKDNVAGET